MKNYLRYVPAAIFLGWALCAYYFFLISRTDWHLVASEFTGMTYANVWEHLLQGRWDVDPDVNVELFVFDHKYYVYFGIFPALIRGMLTLFYDIHDSVPRLGLLIAAMILAVAHVITAIQFDLHKGETKRYFYLLVGVLLLGTPAVYILTPAHSYHEAILWSLAMDAVFNLFFIRFALSPGKNTVLRLICLGPLAASVILSRASVGIAPFLALAILGLLLFLRFINKQKQDFLTWVPVISFSRLALVAVVWFLCGCSALYVNYKKFGDPLNFQPLENYVVFQNEDGTFNDRGLAIAKYGVFRWDNSVPMFEYYFIPHADNFSKHWPYLVLGNTIYSHYFSSHIDYRESRTFMPLTLSAPFLLFFSLFGLFRRPRSWSAFHRDGSYLLDTLAFANLAPGLILLGMWGACLRYSVDFLPALVTGTLLTFYFLKLTGSHLLAKKKFFYSCLVMTIFSIYVVHSTLLIYTVTNPTVPFDSRKKVYDIFIGPLHDLGY